MSKKETKPTSEVDADGLVVQKYRSQVLVVVPPKDYGEECLRYMRSSLYNVHVGTRAVSTQTSDLIKGRHQDEFLADESLAGANMDGYSGLVVAGGEGALALLEDPDVLRLVREAVQQRKLVAAWGHAVAILARAGILKGKKVTGHPSVKDALVQAGAKYSGRQVETDGVLVTGLDDASGMRFGKALAAIVGI